jgi:hypothetical protein
MPPEPCGHQRWAALVRQGPAHGSAIAPDDLRLRGRASVALSLDGTHSADPLLQCLLRAAVRCVHRLGGGVEVMEVTPVMRHLGPGEGDSPADGVLAVGEHPHTRDCQRVRPRVDQRGKGFLRGRQQAAGQEYCGGEPIAQDPEDRLPDVGLEASERQDDPAMGGGALLKAGGVRPRERHERCIAFQQRQDRPGSPDDVTAPQRLMELCDTSVLGIAQGAYEGDNLEAALVRREGVPPLLLWPRWRLTRGTSWRKAPTNREPQSEYTRQRCDGPVVGGRCPPRAAPERTVPAHGLKGLPASRLGAGCCPCQGAYLHRSVGFWSHTARTNLSCVCSSSFFSHVVRLGAGEPRLGAPPVDSQALERVADGLEAAPVGGEAAFAADLRRSAESPETAGLANSPGAFV